MFSGVCWGIYNSYLGYCLERDDTMRKNQSLVETMVSALDNLNKDVESGIITLEDAQHRGKDLLRSARYEGVQYFWVNDLKGKVLVHPIVPELEGQDVHETKPEVINCLQNLLSLQKIPLKAHSTIMSGQNPAKIKIKNF